MDPFTRICITCNKTIIYKNKESYKAGIKRNSPCVTCANKARTGDKNPFFGKKHTAESKEKARKNTDKSWMQSDNYKQKVSQQCSGSGNPMHGKTVYGVWLEKYGKEKADELLKNSKEKLSIKSSGSNNPMYGKPSPNGSGNGWSGWYNKKFFRSIRELSYMVYLDENKINWKSAENIKIPYKDYEGKERNYFPDFIIDNKILLEIKPLKLQTSVNVLSKKEAAEFYCSKNNLEYKLIDPEILSNEKIKLLRENGTIKFTDRYEKKFLERYDGT